MVSMNVEPGSQSNACRRASAGRHLALALAASAALVGATLGAPATASAQGRCIRAYGTPACNTKAIEPVFAPTGWHTTGLDHITFRVADPQAEAAFYTALMDWKLRSDDGNTVVMDIGNWGTAVFQKAPKESFPPPGPARNGRQRDPVYAEVVGFGFSIVPWNARTVEQELRRRGLNPVADNDGQGFESFHVKDLDGFDLQISNGQGYAKQRMASPANAMASAAAPFGSTGWQTVWLDHISFGVANYKAAVSFYKNLLGWGPTYDEGSQNEMMIGDVGDIIVRGGNPLDPGFADRPASNGANIGHISWGISPWDTDGVRKQLEDRGLPVSVDTSDGTEIHIAQFKSYHTRTPNGYNLQISYNTHDTRLNLAIAVNPRRPGVKWP